MVELAKLTKEQLKKANLRSSGQIGGRSSGSTVAPSTGDTFGDDGPPGGPPPAVNIRGGAQVQPQQAAPAASEQPQGNGTPYDVSFPDSGVRGLRGRDLATANDSREAFMRTPVHGGTRMRSNLAGKFDRIGRTQSPYGPGGISGGSGSLRGNRNIGRRERLNLQQIEGRENVARINAEAGIEESGIRGSFRDQAAQLSPLEQLKTKAEIKDLESKTGTRGKIVKINRNIGEPNFEGKFATEEVALNTSNGTVLNSRGEIEPPTKATIDRIMGTLDSTTRKSIADYFLKRYPNGDAPPAEVGMYIEKISKEQ